MYLCYSILVFLSLFFCLLIYYLFRYLLLTSAKIHFLFGFLIKNNIKISDCHTVTPIISHVVKKQGKAPALMSEGH